MRADATYIGYSRVELSCPYDADFVADLKRDIPARHRSWDPARKLWTVFGLDREFPEYAIDLMREYFAPVMVHEWERPSAAPPPPPPPPPRPPSVTDPDYAALHLLSTAPKELITAAYKVLAKRYHPDLGGDDREMQALNAAMDRLRQRGAA